MTIKQPTQSLYKISCLALDELGRPLHVKNRRVLSSSCDKIEPALVTFDELRTILNEHSGMQVYVSHHDPDQAAAKEFYVVTKRSSEQMRTLLDRTCEIETQHAIAVESMAAMWGQVYIG